MIDNSENVKLQQAYYFTYEKRKEHIIKHVNEAVLDGMPVDTAIEQALETDKALYEVLYGPNRKNL